MDIRRIRAEDLKVRNFVFMEMSEASEREWRGQPLTFDGVVFGFCTCGHSDFRLDYKVSRISAGELFVLLPGHIFTTLESTADFEMRLLLVSRDFLYSLPVSFDFDWLKVVEPARASALTTELWTILPAYIRYRRDMPPMKNIRRRYVIR